jgi:membrane protease YdiL (CAAX protease family)
MAASVESSNVESGGEVRSRRENALEVAAFLFLIGPSLVYSFLPSSDTGSAPLFSFTAIATILRDLSLVTLILFFLRCNREAVLRIGWTLRHAWRDFFLGVVLFVPLFFGAGWLDYFLNSIGFTSPPQSSPSLTPTLDIMDLVLAILLVIVVAIAEETIFRGYLINRLSSVFGSTAVGLILASVIFSIGHGYEGTAGVVTVGVMGLVFGLVYLWRKSLVASMTMHFLQDFLSIVLMPFLTGQFSAWFH